MWCFFLFRHFRCVVVAALAAGLTMGLLSIEPYQLKVLLETEPGPDYNEEELQELEEVFNYYSCGTFALKFFCSL